MQPTLQELAAGFRDRRVLIAGGLGFLGSNLARALAAEGANVTVIDALLPGHGGLRYNLAGVEDRVAVHVRDVRDQAGLDDLLEDQQVVFNLFGQTSHLDSMRDPLTDLEHNCRAQVIFLDAIRRAARDARVVFASTRQLYGSPEYLPVDEAHPVNPVDINGVHKWAGEAYHRLYGDLYGLAVSVLRLTNTFGPRMRVRDGRQTFLGLWIRLALTGKTIDVFGDGTQLRDLTFVDDCLRAFLLAASREEAVGQTFNLGDRRAVSLEELARMLTDLTGSGSYRLVPFPSDQAAIDIGDYQGDHSKIEQSLGWSPAVELEAGLGRTVEFFSQHGDQYWRVEE